MNTGPNPKDSIKSTWRRWDRAQWAIQHWIFEVFAVHPVSLDEPVPAHSKQDKVPHVPGWSMHRWVLVHAFIPLAVHQIYIWYTGRNLGPIAVFFLYNTSFKAIAIHEFQILRRLGHTHGFLDGDKHERDGVPDVGVAKTLISLVLTTIGRMILAIDLTYRKEQGPDSIKWAWLPLEIGLYGIILDFWFYWYHRLMHQADSMWHYHRTHHLTKHPNPLLSLYADGPQEVFDIVGIPLMAFLTLRAIGLPVGFYEWWIIHQYVVFAELAGHSGIRMHATPPSTFTWLLQLFDAELVIEDHDLHHRKGWKKSHNYGKQTRLWDRVFGTCHSRIECLADNIDYQNLATFPLY